MQLLDSQMDQSNVLEDIYNKIYAQLDINDIKCFFQYKNQFISGKLILNENIIFEPHNKVQHKKILKPILVDQRLVIYPDQVCCLYTQQNVLSIYDFLSSLSKSPEQIEQALNCAHLARGGKQIKFLDLQEVQEFASSTAEIKRLCRNAKTVVLQTYQNTKFCFVTQFATELMEHLKLFLNIREIFTSGSEDFEYTVIREEQKAQNPSQNLIIRNAVTFQKKVPIVKKVLQGVEQIKYIQELKLKEIQKQQKQKIYKNINKLVNFSDSQNLTPQSESNQISPDVMIPTDDPLGCDIAVMLRINFDKRLDQNAHYFGRKSQILSEEYLLKLHKILPRMLSQFKLLVQFTSVFDGRNLSNLYNSYDFQPVSGDSSKYNTNINITSLKLSQTQIILIKARNQLFGVVFTGQLASIQGGTYYGSFIFNLTQNTCYPAVSEFILKNKQLVFGVSGSALVIQQDLLTVQTSSSTSYDPPELFSGERFSLFVQAEVDCVEVLRFVIE
ncbi:TLD_family protein [Hexamita inflata]|uniref:Oxidation resistance protein 1 n=1 Tax=Hexamita inflata TaxID=28002 RepID=A0AA86TQC7_9EUKA|nr:TLD family protein [Hexamita inflata]